LKKQFLGAKPAGQSRRTDLSKYSNRLMLGRRGTSGENADFARPFTQNQQKMPVIA
jgi:hypothetical protein